MFRVYGCRLRRELVTEGWKSGGIVQGLGVGRELVTGGSGLWLRVQGLGGWVQAGNRH